jgi:proline iminopeptidase
VTDLYPPIEPYRSGMLRVSEIHEVYWEESGAPDGTPVVFVHGGPGGGTSPDQRRFFDPAAYRIVLFDQRGCGKSTPTSCLDENTTWDLVADMERIREHLGIDRWVVFGGSWGSTLALAYAQSHPDRVRAIVLRGIFLLRPKELRWYYQEGASFVYPDAWESFVAPIPEEDRDDLMAAFHRRLTGDDAEARRAAAKAWSVWEGSTSWLLPSTDHAATFEDDEFADAFARIENHYFVNGGFFDHPDQLLDGVGRIRHIPAVIVQGRYDMPCPVTTAWELHRRWPEADFHIVPDAGHAAMEPGTRSLLVEATDRFRGAA